VDVSLRPARKRIGQGVRALLAFATPVDDDAAHTVLVTPALIGLFKRMRRSEQLHSLRVMKTLQAQGADHPDLLVCGAAARRGEIALPAGTGGADCRCAGTEAVSATGGAMGQGAPRDCAARLPSRRSIRRGRRRIWQPPGRVPSRGAGSPPRGDADRRAAQRGGSAAGAAAGGG
jgi:hypothetical protein